MKSTIIFLFLSTVLGKDFFLILCNSLIRRSCLPPAVQVEVEGGAKGQGEGDGLPLAGRGLAEVQALGH